MSGDPISQSGAELAMLAELLAELATAGNLEQIATTLRVRAKWIVPNDRCSLVVCDDDRLGWKAFPCGTVGRTPELPDVIRQTILRGQSIVHEDRPEHAPSTASLASGIFGPGHRSVLCLPLKAAGTTFGVLTLGSKQPDTYPRRPSVTVELLRMNVSAVVQSVLRLAQAEKISELRTRLMATVSHDYKSPLAAILGFSELMLAREYQRDRQRDMLELIRSETLRLNTLVIDVLDLSRMSLQGVDLRSEPLDLPSLIEYCISTYGADGGRVSNHTFHVDVASTLPPVNGDSSRITQVLMNLIGNAVKYSPHGGEIRVCVRAEIARDEATVTVADSGMGMDPAEIGGLFEPFTRTKGARASGIEGSGLGLAICQEIARAHGGRLSASSNGLGLGSTFMLALPLTPLA
jgi:signal transduction histidine kinase